jgi:hypothetical protein
MTGAGLGGASRCTRGCARGVCHDGVRESGTRYCGTPFGAGVVARSPCSGSRERAGACVFQEGDDVRGAVVCGVRDHPPFAPFVRQSAERPGEAGVDAGRSLSRRGSIARLGRASGRLSRTNGLRVADRAPAYDARDE